MIICIHELLTQWYSNPQGQAHIVVIGCFMTYQGDDMYLRSC